MYAVPPVLSSALSYKPRQKNQPLTDSRVPPSRIELRLKAAVITPHCRWGRFKNMNPWMEASMNQILAICCFCEKVRDDAATGAGDGLWQDMKIDKVLRGLRQLSTVVAYGCCPDCLTDDPCAIAFRTRRRHSGPFLTRGKTEKAYVSADNEPTYSALDRSFAG